MLYVNHWNEKKIFFYYQSKSRETISSVEKLPSEVYFLSFQVKTNGGKPDTPTGVVSIQGHRKENEM